MYPTVYFVSSLGLIAAGFCALLNYRIIRRIIEDERNHQMTLFFYRFVMDVVIGVLMAIYLSLLLLYMTSPDSLEIVRSHVVLLALPSSNVVAARAIVATCITIERNLAMYCPIFYHQRHLTFPYSLILLASVVFGLLEDVVLFWVCDSWLFIPPPNCVVFGCSVNNCFKNYWVSWKNIVFFVTLLFSILLCAKLLFRKYSNKSSSRPSKMSRINCLALIDVATVLTLDFVPSVCANIWPHSNVFSFEYVGPHNAVITLLGRAADSLLAYQIIMRRSHLSLREDSDSSRQKLRSTI